MIEHGSDRVRGLAALGLRVLCQELLGLRGQVRPTLPTVGALRSLAHGDGGGLALFFVSRHERGEERCERVAAAELCEDAFERAPLLGSADAMRALMSGTTSSPTLVMAAAAARRTSVS